MKISARGEYAILALLELAIQYKENKPVTVQVISQKQNVPENFLLHILLELQRHGLVISKRGSQGGYVLAISPKNITLGKVLRIFDGTPLTVRCLEPLGIILSCENEIKCGIKEILFELQEKILKLTEEITFADIVKRLNKKIQKSQEQNIKRNEKVLAGK